MNKYGYFRYSDFAVGAKENASYSINKELQEGSALTQLSVGVEPYDFSTFEQNEYITSQPKLLYRYQQDLGLLIKETSDENGVFEEPIVLTISFSRYFSMSGITIDSRNIIKDATITAFRDDIEIINKKFSATTKKFFYSINATSINKIVLTISKINEPNRFFGIFDIAFGREVIFDETSVIDVDINRKYSLLGDTLEYDTLSLNIFTDVSENFLFQKNQRIDWMNDGKVVLKKYYIDNVKKINDNQYLITAYDVVKNLEGEFMGGMFENIGIYELIRLIMPTKYKENSDWFILSGGNQKFTGYIPITTVRKALQMVAEASICRILKTSALLFMETDKITPENLAKRTLSKDVINKNPKETFETKIRSVILKQHNYSKGTEFIEAYHWYVSTTENALIKFDQPLHSLEAYEVIGVDESGMDIIDTEKSKNVTFIETGANYCIISNKSSNKIVIKGLNYNDNVKEYKKTNPLINVDDEYEDIVIDLPIMSDPEKVLDLLFDLYIRDRKIEFLTSKSLTIGYCYNILGNEMFIKSINDNWSGIYEVEAV